MSNIEVFFALLSVALALIAWSLTEMAVPRAIKIGGLLLGICSLVGAFALPGYERWFAPKTYLYFIVGRGLAENSVRAPREFIARRVFALRQHGPKTLHDVNVIFHDNQATANSIADYSVTYPIIDPKSVSDKGFERYFWWPPARPWSEDYTVRFATHDLVLRERIIVQTINGFVQIAIRVTEEDGGGVLFSCKDASLTAAEWVRDQPQECQKFIPQDPQFSMSFEPKPFVLNLAAGSKMQTIDATPQYSVIPPVQETTSDIRRLTDWQRQNLHEALVKLGHRKLLIIAGEGEHTLRYAYDFEEVFRSAFWIVKGPIHEPKMTIHLIDVGLSAPPTDNSTAPKLRDALLIAGVKSRKFFQMDSNIHPGVTVLWVGVRSPEGENPDFYLTDVWPQFKTLTNF
jgi:hypothetical protein